MSDLVVEVFREDVDRLTDAIIALVAEHTAALPEVDRSVIVAASLANVSCRTDGALIDQRGEFITIPPNGACARLRRIAVKMWKDGA